VELVALCDLPPSIYRLSGWGSDVFLYAIGRREKMRLLRRVKGVIGNSP
jgi:hypothetical protein